MKGLVVAVGEKDSLGKDRLLEIRGLLEFGSEPLINYTLRSFRKVGVEDTLLLVQPNHQQQYETALANSGDNVKIEAYRSPSYSKSDMTFAYIDGFRRLGDKEPVLVAPDDEIFDISLEGLVNRFQEVNSSVMAVRDKSLIDNFKELNYGWCVIDKEGKFTDTKSSHHDKTIPWPEGNDKAYITLGMCIIHPQMINSLFKDIKNPNITGDQLIKKYSTWFYAWIINEGFWADVGKTKEKAEQYFSQANPCAGSIIYRPSQTIH